LIPVIFGSRAIEVIECSLVVASIVEDVAEVDAGFGVIGIHLQGPAQCRNCRFIIAKAVLRIADARDCFGGVGCLLRCNLEEVLGFVDQAFAKKRASDLKHQLDVILITQLEGVSEAFEGLLFLAEFQKCLAQSGERILVIRIEDERFLEAATGPRVFFAGVVCVANSYVELHRVRVEAESLAEYVKSFVILSFVIQLMRSFVVLFRTQKRCWHCYAPSEESSISLLYSLDTALFKLVTSGQARLR